MEESKGDEESLSSLNLGDDGKDSLASMKRASWQTVSFNLLAVMFGATQLGFTFGQMGWVLGGLAIGLSAISTWASGILIGRAAIRTGAQSYPELGFKAFGRKGKTVISAAQWMSYFLTGMTQIAFSGAGYQQTFKGTKLGTFCTEGWMLVTTCLLAPCVMVPSFEEAVGMSVIVVGVQCFGLLIMYSQIFANGRYASEGLCYTQWTASSVLAAVANCAFSFGGHGVIPELIREMREPKDFEKAFNVAYGFTVPMYVFTGSLAFWAWGNASSANWVENLQSTNWVHAYNWINTVATFPLVVVGQVVLFLNVELSYGVLPTDTWVNSNALKKKGDNFSYRPMNNKPPLLEEEDMTDDASSQNNTVNDVKRKQEAALLLFANEIVEDSAFKDWIQSFPPILVRAVFRTSYVFAMYAAAYALIGVGLGNLTDLTGALGICALTYWMPFVIHAKVFWKDYSKAGLLWNAANIVFGVFISVAGTYFAAKELFSGSFNFFKESSCKEGAYFWGNDLWGNSNLQEPIGNNHTAKDVYDLVVQGCCQRGDTCGQ